LKKGPVDKAEADTDSTSYPFFFECVVISSSMSRGQSSAYDYFTFFCGIHKFFLKCTVEVPLWKMPNLARWVHFQIMVSALSVMNELRKGRRLVLYSKLLDSPCKLPSSNYGVSVISIMLCCSVLFKARGKDSC
jgi:hypothetical protein